MEMPGVQGSIPAISQLDCLFLQEVINTLHVDLELRMKHIVQLSNNITLQKERIPILTPNNMTCRQTASYAKNNLSDTAIVSTERACTT